MPSYAEACLGIVDAYESPDVQMRVRRFYKMLRLLADTIGNQQRNFRAVAFVVFAIKYFTLPVLPLLIYSWFNKPPADDSPLMWISFAYLISCMVLLAYKLGSTLDQTAWKWALAWADNEKASDWQTSLIMVLEADPELLTALPKLDELDPPTMDLCRRFLPKTN